jgi:hypothetical protein
MGFVTAGKLLTENHPFFRAFDSSSEAQVARVPSGHPDAAYEDHETHGDHDDDDDDDDDDEWVAAVEHVDESEGEEEKFESDEEDDGVFLDAEDGE